MVNQARSEESASFITTQIARLHRKCKILVHLIRNKLHDLSSWSVKLSQFFFSMLFLPKADVVNKEN